MIVIEGGRIFDGERIREFRRVMVDDGRPEEEKLSLDGQMVIPGFVDPFSFMGVFEEGGGMGDDTDEETKPCNPEISAADGINPRDQAIEAARLSGIWAVGVSPGLSIPVSGFGSVISTYGGTLRDILIKREGFLCVNLWGMAKRVSPKNNIPKTRMGIVGAVREMFYKAVDYSKKQEKAFSLGMENLRKALAGEIPVFFGAFRVGDIEAAISIVDEFKLRGVIVGGAQAHLCAVELKRRGIPVILGPIFTGRTLEMEDLSPENAVKLVDAGLDVSLSTFHVWIREDFLRHMAGCLVPYGVRFEEALKMVSSNPAKALGLEYGIEEGKGVVLFVWEGDPLDFSGKVVRIIKGRVMEWK